MANLIVEFEQIREKVRDFPALSGCYIMKDRCGAVLYVGKAKNLKARVASYFRECDHSPKTKALLGRVCDIDFIITANETEALIVENRLIKEYSPKYNISLKDDRTYPYVVADMSEKFPTLSLVRVPPKNLANKKIWGPFVVGSGIRELLQTVLTVFKIRDCSNIKYKRAKVPCLKYQMESCFAPCCLTVNRRDYLKKLNMATAILEGDGQSSLVVLRKEMDKRAKLEEFEKAAHIRDEIEVIENFLATINTQHVESLDGKIRDVDFIFIYQEEDDPFNSDLIISHVRAGKFLGNICYYYKHLAIESEVVGGENLSFIFNHYARLGEHLPSTILLSEHATVDTKILEQAINEKLRSEVEVSVVSEELYPLLKMAKQQAVENKKMRKNRFNYLDLAAKELQQLLKLKTEVNFIECFDIAIFQGSSPVAAKVAFRDGVPDKSSYRHYKLKQRPEGNNDFEMMREAFEKRLRSGDLPDIFLIDGGSGQVNICLEEIDKKGINIPIVGIAKGREKFKYDRLIVKGMGPYQLDGRSPMFRLLTQIRDEAHRFSRVLHHKLELGRVLPDR